MRPYSGTATPCWQHVTVVKLFLWHATIGNQSDLLITDVIMPTLGGPDLWRALKDCHPEARVSYMSGYPADELDEAASFLQNLLRRPCCCVE